MHDFLLASVTLSWWSGLLAATTTANVAALFDTRPRAPAAPTSAEGERAEQRQWRR